jgi:hypothetical protein
MTERDHGDPPIPREGKLKGWRQPKGVQQVGDRATPDACPFCGTEVQPDQSGMLGQPSMGEVVNPEPWQEIAECPACHAGLRRIPGDPWIGSA